MKNKKKLYTILAVMVVVIAIVAGIVFKNSGDIDFSIESLRSWINNRPYTELIFVCLWVLRLVLFIPGMTLMVLGGLIFNPLKAFILCLSGLLISDSLVFFLAKTEMLSGVRNKLSKKYPDIIELLESYNYKILAIGVLCPIAPTDVIVFLASYMGMSYFKFVSIFIGANLPALILYSFLGESLDGSMFNTVFIIITLVATAIISIRFWNQLKGKLKHKF